MLQAMVEVLGAEGPRRWIILGGYLMGLSPGGLAAEVLPWPEARELPEVGKGGASGGAPWQATSGRGMPVEVVRVPQMAVGHVLVGDGLASTPHTWRQRLPGVTS